MVRINKIKRSRSRCCACLRRRESRVDRTSVRRACIDDEFESGNSLICLALQTAECKYIYFISRAGGPYREKLCPRSWMYGKVFPDTDRPRPGNNIFFFAIIYERIRIGLLIMSWCVHAKHGFPPRNPRKCQLRIQDWQSSIQTEEMVPNDELVYCFYCFLNSHGGWTKLTLHLNSCVVKIYLRIGDVYASNSPTEFQLYGFQINLENVKNNCSWILLLRMASQVKILDTILCRRRYMDTFDSHPNTALKFQTKSQTIFYASTFGDQLLWAGA